MTDILTRTPDPLPLGPTGGPGHRRALPRLERAATDDRGGLAAVAAALAEGADPDRVPIGEGEARACLRLAVTDTYDAWLIAWATTGAVDLHDHGGSIGIVRVVAGALQEVYTDRRPGATLRRRRLAAGATVAIPAHRIHAVSNVEGATALSVHVYSPPLRAMTFFDTGTGLLAPRRTESERDWEAGADVQVQPDRPSPRLAA